MSQQDGTIIFISMFNGWPPPGDLVFYTGTTDGLTVNLCATVTGCINASFVEGNGVSTAQAFRPIAIRGSGPIHVGLTWFDRGRRANLYVNGEPVEGDASDTPFTVNLPGILPVPQGRMYAHLRSEGVTDNAERLFLQTVADLDELVVRGDEYSLITASGRLRLLLIDGQPLVHLVNRTHRRTLEFHVLDWPPLDQQLAAELRPLDPSFLSQFPGAVVHRLTLKQLLERPILSFDRKQATVREVIKACANAKGGVHFGQAANDAEIATLAWDDAVRLLGQRPSLLTISEICCVTLRGLGTLVNAVTKSA